MAETFPNVDALICEARSAFKYEFNDTASVAVFAPGRVNLIGEHVDYCDGFVLPMALPLVTVIVGKTVEGNVSTVVTTNEDADLPKKVTFNMPDETNKLVAGCPMWANYFKGVVANFHACGSIPAFNAVVMSSVPIGGGLSSSAAIEVATYTFLEAITGGTTQQTAKALACQKAENEFVGMPCGIMDQFVSVMGKAGNVLLIDCRSQEAKLIPFQSDDVAILITNSNVKHELSDSEYSTRRKQCEEAKNLLQKCSWRDVTPCDVENLAAQKVDEALVKRARHVVSEIDRTSKAAEYLEKCDFEAFGKCMIESHNSLSKDFEVSCQELDSLVDLAVETEGVLGSRMTGGGFGGCTVTLVKTDAVDAVIDNIKGKYCGTPTFYVCKPSDGAQIIEM